MKKYKSLIIFLLVIAFFGFLILLGRLTNKPEMILFFGDTCPHCKTVDTYISDNGIRNKLEFQELEVFNNPNNSRLLTQKAKQCGISTVGGVGVPLFFDGEKCFQGSEPIIDFLKTK